MGENEMIINSVKVTMAAEGQYIDNEDILLISSFLNKEITEQEGIEKIKSDILLMMER
ncbi:MAG: hypothetical protein RSE00_03275 [Clostridia bacterium]